MSGEIQAIEPWHDSRVAEIIRQVGGEYGAIGEGFGPGDAEVDAMSQHYQTELGGLYLVATVNGNLVGGGGVAGFNGSKETCELRKLFLLPEFRGLGLGKQITQRCLEFGKSHGFRRCYLDTLKSMTSAIGLYEKLGFHHLDHPLDGTIHNGCDVWMVKNF